MHDCSKVGPSLDTCTLLLVLMHDFAESCVYVFAALLATCAGLADSLIEALNDRDETVRQTIVTSLVDMGRHKLDVILRSGHSFLIKHPKVCCLYKRAIFFLACGLLEQCILW